MSDWTPEKIRALRKGYGESQDDFSRRFRLTVDGYRLWEQGRGFPSGPATVVLDRLQEDLDAGEIREPETTEFAKPGV